MNTGIGGLVCW